MRITPTISILSALVTILFASTAVWAPSVSAATNSSKQTGVTKAQPQTQKKIKSAGRLTKVRVAKNDTLRPAAPRYLDVVVTGRTPVSTWNTAATYGGSAPQTGQQMASQAQVRGQGVAQAAAPQVQVSQVPATVCYNYNPCTTCWSAPYYPQYGQWDVPATYGGAPQQTAASPSYALPPAQPAQGYGQTPVQTAQAPATVPAVTQQAQPALGQTVVCYNTSWRDIWPLSYLSNWCF